MKKILMPHFEVTGKDSYPDSYKLFSNMEKIEFNGELCWVCNYRGSMHLENGTNNHEQYAGKFVDMGVFVELLPDRVIVELEAIKNGKTIVTSNIEEKVARILRRINFDKKIDVFSNKLSRMLTAMVNSTEISLNQTKSDSILNTLQKGNN